MTPGPPPHVAENAPGCRSKVRHTPRNGCPESCQGAGQSLVKALGRGLSRRWAEDCQGAGQSLVKALGRGLSRRWAEDFDSVVTFPGPCGGTVAWLRRRCPGGLAALSGKSAEAGGCLWRDFPSLVRAACQSIEAVMTYCDYPPRRTHGLAANRTGSRRPLYSRTRARGRGIAGGKSMCNRLDFVSLIPKNRVNSSTETD